MAEADSTKKTRKMTYKEALQCSKIDGCYVNLEWDYDPTDPNSSNTHWWRCPYCFFKNTKRTYFCAMCHTRTDFRVIKAMTKQEKRKLRYNREEVTQLQINYITRCCQEQKKCYLDKQFPPDDSSLYYDPESTTDKEIIKWRRIRNTVHEDKDSRWALFRGPLPTDVMQDNSSDCWFLSALAAVATREELLFQLFTSSFYSKEGVYAVNLYKNGIWESVIVDDYFPCDTSGYLYFVKAPRKQLWVALVQKAAAKLFGCYESLAVGLADEGFTLLTGQPCQVVTFQREFDDDWFTFKQELVWQKLLRSKELGFLMAVTSGGQLSDAHFERAGLIVRHSFAVLDVREVGSECLLKLLDPQVIPEWNGDYSYESHKWTPLMRRLLKPEPPESGTFWITYRDVIKYFFNCVICKIGSWNVLMERGLLLPFANVYNLTCFSLHVPSCTDVTITLFQDSVRSKTTNSIGALDISVLIFGKCGSTIGKPVLFSRRRLKSFVSCFFVLKAGQYVIVPLAFRHWFKDFDQCDSYPRFVLTIHSSKTIYLRPFYSRECLLADVMIKLALEYGSKQVLQDYADIYFFTNRWLGGVAIVENRSNARWLLFDCDFRKSKNVTNTRLSLFTRDYIPPLTRQVINVITVDRKGELYDVKLHFKQSYLRCTDHIPEKLNFPEINICAAGLHSPRPLFNDN